MHSRYEIGLEQYALSIGVEARSTLEIGTTAVLPAAVRYQTELALNVAALKAAGVEADTASLIEVIDAGGRPAGGAGRAQGALAADAGHGRLRPRPSTPGTRCCRRWRRCAPPPTRSKAIVADDLWPLPTYQEMLYIL